MAKPWISCCLFASTLVAQDVSLENLRQEGRWKQLRPRVEGWFRQKPQDPYALLWMSRVKQAFGDPEGALELARKAAAARGDDPEIQAQLGMAAGACAGRADGRMKQFSLAREMKKALETSMLARPGDEEAAQYLLQFYLQAPGIVGGSVSRAEELAQRVAQQKPMEGLLLRANIAYYTKNGEAARQCIQQALAKNGTSEKALLYMASHHLRQKPQALDAALACYRKALEAHPRAIQAHAQAASILAEQGKWAELETCLNQARRAVPENLLPYYAAGRNLLTENRSLERAETLLRTYLTQEPEGGTPDHAITHWRMGLLKEKQGKKPEAIQEFELALKLRPTFKAARQDLERVQKG